jgi:hypothetical protein
MRRFRQEQSSWSSLLLRWVLRKHSSGDCDKFPLFCMSSSLLLVSDQQLLFLETVEAITVDRDEH